MLLHAFLKKTNKELNDIYYRTRHFKKKSFELELRNYAAAVEAKMAERKLIGIKMQ